MATQSQTRAATKNIRKAQAARKGTSKRAHSIAQPGGRGRAKPGAKGGGDFFHIQVRPKREFVTFRTQDVGEPGGIERVAGKRTSGSWDTQKWLISKTMAHLEGGRLVGDAADAKKVLKQLGSSPVHIGGDRFTAKPRRNIPESEKPTAAQMRARSRNIKKAQVARHRRPS